MDIQVIKNEETGRKELWLGLWNEAGKFLLVEFLRFVD